LKDHFSVLKKNRNGFKPFQESERGVDCIKHG
jgi:hypothetical protein